MNTHNNNTDPKLQRVMIFIDGSNLYHVLKQSTGKHDLDYMRFAQKLAGKRNLIRTYYYNIKQESSENPRLAENQERFLKALYETDYLEVKLGIWKARGHTMVEKGVDVMIATDLITHAYEDHYDVAILVSGDADFYPALQAVKDIGKQVEVAAFDSNLSSEAARQADVITKFNNQYFQELWMSSSRKHELEKNAAARTRVTDEAASPNGEDKASSNGRSSHNNQNGRISRQPAHQNNGKDSQNAANRRRIISQIAESRNRAAISVRSRISASKTPRYAKGKKTKVVRVLPPRIRQHSQNKNERRQPTESNQSRNTSAQKTSAQKTTTQRDDAAKRPNWIARMLRSNK